MFRTAVLLFGRDPSHYDRYKSKWFEELYKLDPSRPKWEPTIIAVEEIEHALHSLRSSQRVDIIHITNTEKTSYEALATIAESFVEAVSKRSTKPIMTFEQPGTNACIGWIFTLNGIPTSFKTVPELALQSARS